MYNIIRNHSNHSYVYTGFEVDGKGGLVLVIRKTFSKQGVKSLLTEYNAISWYCGKLNIKTEDVVSEFQHSESYGILKLKFHPGDTGDYFKMITENYNKISSLINHYASLLKKNGAMCVHGDLSLGNIIFEGNTVKWIIDWENSNNIMPQEYDLVYCITENCLFRLRRKNKLLKQEVLTYWDLLQEIDRKIGIDSEVKRNPARWCKSMALEYMKGMGIHHMKCPFVACEDKYIDTLDSLLTEK